MSHGDAERILDGSVPAGDSRLGSLAGFVADARATFTTPPAAEVQARHMTAMAQQKQARLRVLPTSAGIRRRLSRAGIVGAAAGVLFAAGSALAATGHLPSPAQTVVSDAAKLVGVHVRGGDHGSANGQLHRAAGQEKASENKARADAFTDAKKIWTECVADKTKHHTGPGPFDPEAPKPEGCGPKPQVQTLKPDKQQGGGPDKKDENKGGQAVPGENGKHGGQGAGVPESPSPTPGEHGGSDQGSSGDGVSGGHSDGGGHGNGRG